MESSLNTLLNSQKMIAIGKKLVKITVEHNTSRFIGRLYMELKDGTMQDFVYTLTI